jgi:hypothetical protein
LKQNEKQRRGASAQDFAIPPQGARRGKYPIPDQARAVEALARVDAEGTAEEKRKVRAAIRKRYPNLPVSQGEPRFGQGEPRPDASRPNEREEITAQRS